MKPLQEEVVTANKRPDGCFQSSVNEQMVRNRGKSNLSILYERQGCFPIDFADIVILTSNLYGVQRGKSIVPSVILLMNSQLSANRKDTTTLQNFDSVLLFPLIWAINLRFMSLVRV